MAFDYTICGEYNTENIMKLLHALQKLFRISE